MVKKRPSFLNRESSESLKLRFLDQIIELTAGEAIKATDFIKAINSVIDELPKFQNHRLFPEDLEEKVADEDKVERILDERNEFYALTSMIYRKIATEAENVYSEEEREKIFFLINVARAYMNMPILGGGVDPDDSEYELDQDWDAFDEFVETKKYKNRLAKMPGT